MVDVVKSVKANPTLLIAINITMHMLTMLRTGELVDCAVPQEFFAFIYFHYFPLCVFTMYCAN